jgi:hypothetical protein
MTNKNTPDYEEVQAIIWDHMQMLLDKILKEEEPIAYSPSHSDTSK